MELPETFQLLDISTGHIPKHTSDALGLGRTNSPAALSDVLSYEPWAEYGWIILVQTDKTAVAQEHPELQALMEHCASRGVQYLKLDSDAPVLPGFPVFDW